MKVIAYYCGRVANFRLWLKEERPSNVVSIKRHKEKRGRENCSTLNKPLR